MSGGSSAPSNTTQTTELPQWAQGAAQSLLSRGDALSQQQMPVYTGQRTADLNANQQAGINLAANRATNGDPTMNAGAANLQDTLNGTYLNGGNPYLGAQIDQASQSVTKNYQNALGNTDSSFARAGGFGGSAWNQASLNNSTALAQGLGDVASNMQYQNYNDERNRQASAQTTALQYGNQAYTDATQLQNAGALQYGLTQQQLDDKQAQYNEQAQSPYKQLDVLGNTIKAAVGGGSSISSTGPGSNPYAQALGGVAALGGLLA